MAQRHGLSSNGGGAEVAAEVGGGASLCGRLADGWRERVETMEEKKNRRFSGAESSLLWEGEGCRKEVG